MSLPLITLYIIRYALLCTCSVLLEIIFCFTLCDCVVLCVDCCVTLLRAATVVDKWCVYCEENISLRNEVFSYVIVFMAYVFIYFMLHNTGQSCSFSV
jgi:hypothetical protein